ncbi:uncharacterized protein LOC133891020 [Phragmites australis]|uniref:uncharacterized protein LOC133891020 n=1 Tax=Phragmites australis TaxID=29695 RepID=UPI002D77517A|nr:uncharacterized protein LOC133891020 [Phragmites australis]
MDGGQAAADAQRAREVYTHGVSKVKAVHNPPLVLMLMLYPSLLAFSMAARNANFALLIPTPTTPGAPSAALHGDDDQWERPLLYRTIVCFVAIIFDHIYLLVKLMVRGPAGVGAPRMTRAFAWFPPIAFWMTTSAFFYNYVTLARYGASIKEWFAAGCSSGIILLITIVVVLTSVPVERVMHLREEAEPVPAAHQQV